MRWPASGVRRIVTVNGPDLQTRATVHALDRELGLRLAGAAGPPARIGLDASRRYTGELGALQRFRGGMNMGTSKAIRKGFGGQLPSTTGLAAQPDPTRAAVAAMAKRRR